MASPAPGVRGAMPFPVRLLAAGAALALLAYVPGLVTRGDVLRGLAVTFLAALVAALGALAPDARRTRPRGRGVVLLLPLLVPALGLFAQDGGTATGTLRLAAPWIALVALSVGALLVGRLQDADSPVWPGLLAAGGVAAVWTTAAVVGPLPADWNPFGRPGIAGPVLAALLAAAVVHPALRPGALRWPLVVLLGVGLLATQSRVGIVAGALATPLALGLARTDGLGRALRLSVVLLAALGILLLALAVGGHVDLPVGGTTLDVRLGLYRASARLVAEAPLEGHGLGSFPAEILRARDEEEARLSRGRRPLVGHDDYLHASVEGGLGAGLALLAWLGALFAMGLGALGTEDAARRQVVAAALGALLAIAIAALGENVLVDPAVGLVAALAAATLVAARTERGSATGTPARLVALALALAALVAAGVKGRDLIADVHLRRYQDRLASPQEPLAAILSARDDLERGALRWRPDSAIAWYRLGVARANLKDGEGAREAYARALEADAGMTEARLDTAQTWLAEGQRDLAAATLDAAVPHDPTRFDLHVRRGHLALGEEPVPGEPSGDDHDPVAALRAYNRAEALAPDRFEVDVAQARLARRRGRLEEAGTRLRLALERVAPEAARILRTPPAHAPGDPEAAARRLLERQRDALNELATRPETAEILLESFRLAELEGRAPDLWIAGLLKLALLVNPRLAVAVEQESRRFLELGRARAERAREAVKGTVTRPDYQPADRAFDAAARRLAGLLQAELLDPQRVLREARRDAEAKAWRLAYARYRALLSHAAALPPAKAAARAAQLDVLAELYSEAAKVAVRFESPLARHAYARAHALRGAAHLLRGEWADARRWLENAVEDDPSDGETRLALARALVRLDELDAAEEALLEALGLAPGLAGAASEDPILFPLLGRERVREALERR